MPASWTTDDLLARVKRKAQRPSTDRNFSNGDILNVAEEELYSNIAPMIRNSRTSLWLKSYSVTVTAGTAGYRIPTDASAGTIRQVWCQDDNGNGGEIPLVEPENRFRYLVPGQPTPAVACLVADEVVLYPTPQSSTWTLTIWYEQRRSRLCVVSECALVTASATTTTFTTSSTPDPTFTVGQRVDVIEGQPNFDLLSRYNTVSAIALPSLTLGTAIESETRVGAYVCPTGFSCIVPLPDLFHAALVLATAAGICEEVRDTTGAAFFRAQLSERMDNLLASIEPRATGQIPVLVNHDSPWRSAFNGGRRW